MIITNELLDYKGSCYYSFFISESPVFYRTTVHTDFPNTTNQGFELGLSDSDNKKDIFYKLYDGIFDILVYIDVNNVMFQQYVTDIYKTKEEKEEIKQYFLNLSQSVSTHNSKNMAEYSENLAPRYRDISKEQAGELFREDLLDTLQFIIDKIDESIENGKFFIIGEI